MRKTYRLGSLEGHTEGSVPDELGDNTECSRDTEEDGVEVLLVETVASLSVVFWLVDLLSEEDTRVGIDIGPGVCH
jgi:hypothetical protein